MPRATNKDLAIAANAHARSIIKRGATQIDNNKYPTENRLALAQAIEDLREISRQRASYVSNQAQINPAPKVISFLSDWFNQQIELSTKYSIGNCGEMALVALDYVMKNAPNVFAELYAITEGDHVFLVVGRAPGSDSNNPLTWGEQAYICDPWADNVYLAHEYQTKLKNYNYVFGGTLRCATFPSQAHIPQFLPQDKATLIYLTLEKKYLIYGERTLVLGTYHIKTWRLIELDAAVCSTISNFSCLNELVVDEQYLPIYQNIAANKGHEFDSTYKFNFLTDFDSTKHTVAPQVAIYDDYYVNTATINEEIKIQQLYTSYQKTNEQFSCMLCQLIDELNNLKTSLNRVDEQTIVVQKIIAIKNMIQRVNNSSLICFYQPDKTVEKIRPILENQVEMVFTEYHIATHLDPFEEAILSHKPQNRPNFFSCCSERNTNLLLYKDIVRGIKKQMAKLALTNMDYQIQQDYQKSFQFQFRLFLTQCCPKKKRSQTLPSDDHPALSMVESGTKYL